MNNKNKSNPWDKQKSLLFGEQRRIYKDAESDSGSEKEVETEQEQNEEAESYENVENVFQEKWQEVVKRVLDKDTKMFRDLAVNTLGKKQASRLGLKEKNMLLHPFRKTRTAWGRRNIVQAISQTRGGILKQIHKEDILGSSLELRDGGNPRFEKIADIVRDPNSDDAHALRFFVDVFSGELGKDSYSLLKPPDPPDEAMEKNANALCKLKELYGDVRGAEYQKLDDEISKAETSENTARVAAESASGKGAKGVIESQRNAEKRAAKKGLELKKKKDDLRIKLDAINHIGEELGATPLAEGQINTLTCNFDASNLVSNANWSGSTVKILKQTKNIGDWIRGGRDELQKNYDEVVKERSVRSGKKMRAKEALKVAMGKVFGDDLKSDGLSDDVADKFYEQMRGMLTTTSEPVVASSGAMGTGGVAVEGGVSGGKRRKGLLRKIISYPFGRPSSASGESGKPGPLRGLFNYLTERTGGN